MSPWSIAGIFGATVAAGVAWGLGNAPLGPMIAHIIEALAPWCAP